MDLGFLRSEAISALLAGSAVAMGAALWTHDPPAHRVGEDGAPGPEDSPRPRSDLAVLRVPRSGGRILLDGDTDDPGWTSPPGPATTGPFAAVGGARARPYADARLVWGDGHLYVALYAADDDIRSRADQPDAPVWLDDSFRLVFSGAGTDYAIEVSPRGVVTDAMRRPGQSFDYRWNSGAHVSRELDGTLNDSTDTDEEWLVEMAIPLGSLGLRGERGERIGLAIRRCDAHEGAPRRCAGWGDADPRELVLD